MQLHELQPSKSRVTAKRVGRGGKRGKTSGRGHKGQKARAGNSTRPEMRDIIKKLPKLRGHGVNRAQTVNADKLAPVVVNVAALEAHFEKGATITPKDMVGAGIIARRRKKYPAVKVLGNGTISKAFTITGCEVSHSARTKIEAAGGAVK